MKKRPIKTKSEKLAYLLGAFGNGWMSKEAFWTEMTLQGYGQDDIDQWLANEYRKDVK